MLAGEGKECVICRAPCAEISFALERSRVRLVLSGQRELNGPWAENGRSCLGRVLQGIDGALVVDDCEEKKRGWL